MSIVDTNFEFPGQVDVYKGKVRDVYNINNEYLVMIASDRISAFDHILPRPIPFKGQVLNQIAARFLKNSIDVCPNWFIDSPHPNVTIGRICAPIRIEMVIRGYLAGHAWRVYRDGGRELCGVKLPDGLKESDRLPEPIITPSTKAVEGHDEDISREAILEQGIVPEKDYIEMERHTRDLFKRGTELAAKRGLILVDTKYEFGYRNGLVTLMDEIHTPDSSRYYYADGYDERQQKGEAQQQLSKEFVREWLIEQGFQGKEGQQMPDLPDAFIQSVSERYIELYEKLMGRRFKKQQDTSLDAIEQSVVQALDKLD